MTLPSAKTVCAMPPKQGNISDKCARSAKKKARRELPRAPMLLRRAQRRRTLSMRKPHSTWFRDEGARQRHRWDMAYSSTASSRLKCKQGWGVALVTDGVTHL